MNRVRTIRAGLDRILAMVVMILVLGLSLIVILGFSSRLIGMPLSWTGEVAGVGLAWLTFYGSALAASRGAHIASPSILAIIPARWRVLVTIISEALTIAFFVLLVWTGLQVIEVLDGSNLVSVPFISQQLTVSALPIGAGLFIVAELLRLPEVLADAARTENNDPAAGVEDDVF